MNPFQDFEGFDTTFGSAKKRKLIFPEFIGTRQ